MRTLRQFHLLIVAGDRTRVIRLRIPRWAVYGALAALALGFTVIASLSGEYLYLRHQWGRVAALKGQVAEQGALIDTFNRRIAEVRSEVASWRALHAKIWEPFGPTEGQARRGAGIGGGTDSGQTAALSGRQDLTKELDSLTATISEEGESLRALERFISKAGKVLAALPSRWPVRGPVNSEFGQRASPWSDVREFHSGIDIGAERGRPVKAPAPGQVLYAGSQADYGLTVILDHGHEIKSLYGHLQKILVTPGQKVERGQVIALSGNTGSTTGPHLHYEIAVRGKPVNPRRYIWE